MLIFLDHHVGQALVISCQSVALQLRSYFVGSCYCMQLQWFPGGWQSIGGGSKVVICPSQDFRIFCSLYIILFEDSTLTKMTRQSMAPTNNSSQLVKWTNYKQFTLKKKKIFTTLWKETNKNPLNCVHYGSKRSSKCQFTPTRVCLTTDLTLQLGFTLLNNYQLHFLWNTFVTTNLRCECIFNKKTRVPSSFWQTYSKGTCL